MAAAPVAIPPRSDTLSPQEATDLNRATLESLRDSPEAPPERASSLSPSNALFHRSKPKSGAKKSGKKRQTRRQIEAVRSNELDVVSAADEPVEGADGVLDLADELLDQLELEEGSAEPAPSESPSHSSSPLDKAGAFVDSIGSKISSGFRGGSSRQAARKERRAQEWQQQADDARREIAEGGGADQAAEERKALGVKLAADGLVVTEIQPDGHCMFGAVADQINLHHLASEAADYHTTRTAAAAYMRDHPNDYMPYLQAEEAGGDGVMSFDDYAVYCDKIESTGLWGGQTELNALAQVYKTPIHVYQSDAPIVKLGDESFHDREPLRIVYYRALYGLGEHYNSLHPQSAR